MYLYKKKVAAQAATYLPEPVAQLTAGQRAEQRQKIAAFARQSQQHTWMGRFKQTVSPQKEALPPVLRAGKLRIQHEQAVQNEQKAVQTELSATQANLPSPEVIERLQAQPSTPAISPVQRTPDGRLHIPSMQAATQHFTEQMAVQRRRSFDGSLPLSAWQNAARTISAALVSLYHRSQTPVTKRQQELASSLADIQGSSDRLHLSNVVLSQIKPAADGPVIQRLLDDCIQQQAHRQAVLTNLATVQRLQAQLGDLEQEAAIQSGPELTRRLEARRGHGYTLPSAIKRQLEVGLNIDLSGVRIHTDAEANALAKRVNAVAFTTGTDIYFQANKYDPHTTEGFKLLAHETTHVKQQLEGRATPGIDADVGLEAEARQAESTLKSRPAMSRTHPHWTPHPGQRHPQAHQQRHAPNTQHHTRILQRKAAAPAQPAPDLETGTPINKPGIVADSGGANIRANPSTSAKLITHLPYNTHLVVQAELPGGWSRIVTPDGKVGYTPTRFLKHNLPDPGAKLHKVTTNQAAETISKQYYSGQTTKGFDHRDFVIVLAALNPKALVGTFNPDNWQAAKFKDNHSIWIPSAAFMQGMKGKYPTSSLTVKGVQAAAKAIGDNLNPLAMAGTVAGLSEGFFMQAWDTIKGVFDFVKSIFNGEIISQAKALWNAIQNLNIQDLINSAGNAAHVALNAYNNATPFDRGRMRGKLVGRLLFEIVLGIVTAGVATAASAALRGIPAIAKFITALQKARRLGKLKISTPLKGNPRLISLGYAELNSTQRKIVLALRREGSRIIVRDSEFSLKDLGAITAHEKVEFAWFRRRGENLIIRGNAESVGNLKELKALAEGGWRFSAHSHPDGVMRSSEGDRGILELF